MADAGANTLKIGRFTALAGVVPPLLLIGGLKFTQTEVEVLRWRPIAPAP